ncbi:MAG: SagB/ThcOx family dehydrogenase [Bacteroidales bacterium]|nr:SagB/ThcOx family dehydrogenase [Bacteroidales bacterium]
MKRKNLIIMFTSIIGAGLISGFVLYKPIVDKGSAFPSQEKNNEIIDLPEPNYESNVSVEEALQKRRSVREYTNSPLTVQEISQLLWAAQGITKPSRGFRTAPSAGALYPLEVYVVIDQVKELDQGVYKYNMRDHNLKRLKSGRFNRKVAEAALGQSSIRQAAAQIIFSAVYERTTQKYGERGIRYVHMEAGHAAQNVFLQAESLGLGTVTIGAFNDDNLEELLNMPEKETALYILPLGRI